MRNYFSFSIVILLSCLTLTGCVGINAEVDSMTYSNPPQLKKPKNEKISRGIYLEKVTGGHAINPLLISDISDKQFKMALEKSLNNAKLLQESKAANYWLSAKIVRIERPLAGLDMTTNLYVNYQLCKESCKIVVYNKTIKSSYTAKFTESLVAVARLKMANEGAARANIKQLIEDLYTI